METRMKIDGEMVRELREAKSWSQDHLARASGLSGRTIQRVETAGVASAETRLALAAALDVPVSVLIVGSSESVWAKARSWRVPVWGWLAWALATAGATGLVVYGSFAGLELPQQLALNLLPWLGLLGMCLAAVAMIGCWQRSRSWPA